MTPEEPEQQSTVRPSARFATTHWSVVLTAAHTSSPAAREALEKLCQSYWYPLYAFLRRQGYQPADAEDLVQAFFARILERDGLRGVERGHGKFRTFLFAAMRHFLASEWDRSQAQKRGGGQPQLSLDELEPEGRYAMEFADNTTPEKLYERAWAKTVLDRVQARLQAEYAAKQQPERFQVLSQFLSGDHDETTYAQAGTQLGLAEGTIKSEIHRLRKRFRALLRSEIAHTVASPAQINDELRALMEIVSR